MVGRVIFAFSSAVVNSMFPLVAGTRDEERRNLRVIATSLLLVLVTGSVLALGLGFAPAGIWTALFGSGFEIAWEVQPPLSSGAVRHHHNRLLAQCRNHYFRNVLQDREHKLGAAGVQRCGDRSDLPLSFLFARSHPRTVGPDGRPAHLCGNTIPYRIAGNA
jgi:hypothetical protein